MKAQCENNCSEEERCEEKEKRGQEVTAIIYLDSRRQKICMIENQQSANIMENQRKTTFTNLHSHSGQFGTEASKKLEKQQNTPHQWFRVKGNWSRTVWFFPLYMSPGFTLVLKDSRRGHQYLHPIFFILLHPIIHTSLSIHVHGILTIYLILRLLFQCITIEASLRWTAFTTLCKLIYLSHKLLCRFIN